MCRQLLALLIALCAVGVTNAQEPAKVDFIRDVQPLFKAHCISCHGPKQQKNAFRLDRRQDALRGGTASVIGPGNAEASQLYRRLIGDRAGLQMPPDGALSPEQIHLIKAWIDQGAEWPDAVSGAIAPPPADSGATQMMELLRQGDRVAFRNLLRAQPQSAKRQGQGGATPLMYAALYGQAEDMRLLLDAGADPNVRNEVGATALMWAADDLDKTRLLLRRGADLNARSDDGRTPTLVATTWSQSYEVVKLLLEQGASPSMVVNSYRGPLTPLRLAAEFGDEAVLRLLVDRGGDPNALGGVPLLLAAQGADAILCANLLIKSADRKALKPAALSFAPPFGSPRALRDPAALKKLVDNGADLAARDQAGRTFLMLAVTSDEVSVQTIETMLQLGADVNAIASDGKTVLDFARQRGNTPVVDLLAKAGAKPGRTSAPPDGKSSPAKSAHAAVARSLPLLQRADVAFLRKTGCVSCHNNSLTALTVSAARKAGIPVDEPVARNQRQEIGAYIEVWRERALQGMPLPGDSDTINYLLLGLGAEKYPPDPATDALARFLKNTQLPDGHWRMFSNRPPLESSEIEMTAVALRALQTYAPKAQRSAYERSLWRAADWLRTARATTTADRVFQLLGLAWAGDAKDALEKPARDLLAEQRGDGGWGQLPSLASDAFATGQALVALSDSGAIAVTDAAYQRGVQYLLANQLADGSWFVRSRAIAFQPYFESGFPHGHDQWISAAATSWATMALIQAAR